MNIVNLKNLVIENLKQPKLCIRTGQLDLDIYFEKKPNIDLH